MPLIQRRKYRSEILEQKGFENAVAVLSVTTTTKQKDAWFPLNVPANPSTHQLILVISFQIKIAIAEQGTKYCTKKG